MEKQDILFRTRAGIFSYRVAGVLICNGKVLLQRPVGETAYAFPGGHANFGENSEAVIQREFKEEIGADITPIRLLWISENFFPWDGQVCHQIGLYYLVDLVDEKQIPLEGCFNGPDSLDGKSVELEFSWVEISALKSVELYPIHAKDKLAVLSDGIEHFVDRESP